MDMAQFDEKFIKSLKAALDESAESLDAEIRLRLTSARSAALEQKKKHRTGFPWLVPAGAFASLATVIFVILLWSKNDMDQMPVMEDLELLSSEESLEMLEDLEFYEWLESQTG